MVKRGRKRVDDGMLKSVHKSIVLTPNTNDLLVKLSAVEGVPVATLIRVAVERYIANKQKGGVLTDV